MFDLILIVFSLRQTIICESPILRHQLQANLTCNCSKEEEIVGLLPSDFHGDAKMDVIVLTKFKPNAYSHGKWNLNLFNIYLVQGSTFSLECKNLENQNILFQSRIQPLLLGMQFFTEESLVSFVQRFFAY